MSPLTPVASLRAEAQALSTSASTSATPAAAPAVATGVAVTTPPASVPAATGAAAAMTTPTPTGTAGTQQAAAGAAAAAEPKAEAFNAPALKLPDEPTTSDVLTGIAGAMSDPTVNQTTAQRLYEFQQQLLDMQKAMTQVILDGMR